MTEEIVWLKTDNPREYEAPFGDVSFFYSDTTMMLTIVNERKGIRQRIKNCTRREAKKVIKAIHGCFS